MPPKSKLENDVLGAELDVKILAGRNLAPMDGAGVFGMGKAKTSDPYVKVSLSDVDKPKFRGLQTSVVPKTLNPEWHDAAFKFQLSPADFKPHRTIGKIYEQRLEMITSGKAS